MSKNKDDYTVDREDIQYIQDIIDLLTVKYDKDAMTPYVEFMGKDDKHNDGLMEMM